jgi:Ni,Fe-hydrogenase III large subunit/NADH:ubiquinone oxidoreductase subunit C
MSIKDILKKVKPGAKTVASSNLLLCQIEQSELVEVCTKLYREFSLQLKTIKATDERERGEGFKIFYIFGAKGQAQLLSLYIKVEKGLTFPTLSREIHEATFYELEINSFFGLIPHDHPALQQFILHENIKKDVYPLRKDFKWNTKLPWIDGPATKFAEIKGEGIYELPVGPVHAGIIEPGHFRFSLAGEEIISLQPKLGYVHKGSEKLFENMPLEKKIALSERISGDMSFTHSLAFVQAVETLGEVNVPQRAQFLRVIYSELERLANHINDIGFILNDTALAFGGSFGMRLKERVMLLNEELTGSRFLRGVNVVGGVTKDLWTEQREKLQKSLIEIKKDFTECVEIIEDKETVINRLRNTGVLEKQVALDHGVVGVAARAVGIPTDVRIDHPYAAYNRIVPQLALKASGDVYARYRVRIMEAMDAIRIILEALGKLPNGEIVSSKKLVLPKNSYSVGMAEGWRGEIVYFVMTDQDGVISRVGVRDPSFLNWPAVPYAVAGNIVPDFPLINKSFNLSYSGFDR